MSELDRHDEKDNPAPWILEFDARPRDVQAAADRLRTWVSQTHSASFVAVGIGGVPGSEVLYLYIEKKPSLLIVGRKWMGYTLITKRVGSVRPACATLDRPEPR